MFGHALKRIKKIERFLWGRPLALGAFTDFDRNDSFCGNVWERVRDLEGENKTLGERVERLEIALAAIGASHGVIHTIAKVFSPSDDDPAEAEARPCGGDG